MNAHYSFFYSWKTINAKFFRGKQTYRVVLTIYTTYFNMCSSILHKKGHKNTFVGWSSSLSHGTFKTKDNKKNKISKYSALVNLGL